MASGRKPKKQKPSLTYDQLTAPVGDFRYSFEPDTFGSKRLPVAELSFTAEWYINLLGTRKKVRPMVRERKFDGLAVEPDDCQVNNAIRKTFGERSERLAIRGDKAKVGKHRFHDEAIVMMTILHALATR